jgi:outer membrane receptor for ferrienterochelin and colicins
MALKNPPGLLQERKRSAMNQASVAAAIFFLLAWEIAAPLDAAQNAPAQVPENGSSEADVPGDEEELRRLLDIIDKHTEIATNSKLNTDYVPGMVTVLDGEDMRSRGMQTVLEALNLVPGIETSISVYGHIDVVARGIGKTGIDGHIQFQVNGISMNSTHHGEARMVPAMPLAQVERIEVIVGPGSAVHGEYAFAGVVNVITKKDGNRLAGSVGSDDYYMGAGVLSFKQPRHDLSLSVNLALADTDGGDVDSGEDFAYSQGIPEISNAPGPTNESREVRSGILDFSFKDFSLSAYYIENGFGDYFGFGNYLPPPDDEIKFRFYNYGAQAKQRLDFTSDMEAVLWLGYMLHKYSTSKIVFAPAGFFGFPDGLITSPYLLESRIDGGFDTTWEGFRHQTLKLAYSFAYMQVEDAWHETNFLPSTGAPLPSITRFSGEESYLEEGIDRWLHSITFQDEIAVGPAVNITAGLRFDDYSDAGTDLSPRLAVVWRATDNHIFKTQYAHAFRPPAFTQLYAKNNPILSGNEDLESETIDTIELGYIYRSQQFVGRTTLFYSRLKDFIIPDRNAGIYVNSDETTVHSGVEISLEQRLGDSLKLDATLSYVDIDELQVGSPTTVANWLGNIGMLYELSPDLVFNLQGRYVGERIREPQDTRDQVDDYFALDATGTIYNLWISGLTLRAGVKNIFDASFHDPSWTLPDASGTYLPTYADDYPRPGRSWWAGVSYKF